MAQGTYGSWPAGPLRSWILFDGANGASNILKADSGKIVSSVTRTGAGVYDLVLNQDLGPLSAWGVIIGTSTPDRMASYAFTQATNTLTITVSDAAGSDADSAYINLMILCVTPGVAA